MTRPLVSWFAVLSLLCILATALVMGFALSSLLSGAVSAWEWENTVVLVRRDAEQAGLDALLAAPGDSAAWERHGREFSRRVTTLPEIVRVKVWDRQATVLWSDEPQLIGQRFPDNRELQEALAGAVAVEIKTPTKREQAYERRAFAVLAEVYVPIISKESGMVVGIAEVYKTPTRLFATIRWARIVIWTISLASGLSLYLVLIPVVRRVYGRQAREEALETYAGWLEERARRLTTLSNLTRLITSAAESEVVFNAVAQAATVLLGAKAAHVSVDDPARRALRVCGSFGFDTPQPAIPAGLVFPYGEGVVGSIFTSRTPEYLSNIQQDSRLLHRQLAEQGGLCAFAGLPLVTGDHAVGVLAILFGAPRGFTPEDKELMNLLADQAAIAIDNAQLLRRLKTHQARLEALLEASRQLSRLQPFTSLLNSIAEACGQLLGADSVGVRLVEGGDLLVAATWGDADQSIVTSRLKIGESLSGRVAATGEPLLVRDVANDPRLIPAHREADHRLGHRGWLGVPVKFGERVAGVLSALTRREEGFSAEDLAFASAFAAGAAVALENSRLYHEVESAYGALANAQDQLVQSQKLEAIGRLAGGVAHYFNNLMTVILGRGELLSDHLRGDGSSHRDLDVILKTAGRAADLTRQLMAFSRQQLLRPKALDLDAFVNDLVPSLRQLVGEGIDLTVLRGTALDHVSADPAQLEQAIRELATNAKDAMPRGGRLSLEMRNIELDETFVRQHPGATSGPHVMLAVSDTGVGMDEPTRARIFEPFFTTEEFGSKTGLGLATVYGIVQQHGGYVSVESEPERGSTFRIYLPPVAQESGEATEGS